MTSNETFSGFNYSNSTLNPAVLEIAHTFMKLQEQMKMIDSSKMVQMFQLSLIPMSINMMPSFLEIQNAFKNLSSVHRQEIAAIGAAIAEPLSGLRLHMNTFYNANSEMLSKLIKNFASIQSDWLKTSTAFMSSYSPIISAIGKFDVEISSLLKAFSLIRLTAPSKIDVVALQNLSSSIASLDFEHNDVDGTLTIDGEMVNTATVKEVLMESLRDSGLLDIIKRTNEKVAYLEDSHNRQAGNLLVIEEAINNLVCLVSKMRESKIKTILTTVIIGLLLNFISNNFVTPLTQPFTDIPVKAIVKLYKKDLKATAATIDIESLKQLRFVTVPRLKVRAGSRMRSHIVAEANIGQIVIVVRKERNWTLIEYIDSETNEDIRGWVFTRYLETIQ